MARNVGSTKETIRNLKTVSAIIEILFFSESVSGSKNRTPIQTDSCSGNVRSFKPLSIASSSTNEVKKIREFDQDTPGKSLRTKESVTASRDTKNLSIEHANEQITAEQ